jgi:protein TonB
MITAGRSKLLGPVASGALHAGLFGLIAGFGMGVTPPVPQPISVELVVPQALSVPATSNGSAAPAPAVPPATMVHRTAPTPPPPAPGGAETRILPAPVAPAPEPAPVAERPSPSVASPAPRPRPKVESGKLARLDDRAAEPAPPAAAPAVPAPAAAGATPSEGVAGEEQAREAAALAGNPPPAYPGIARRRGIEGQVVLRVAVDPSGHAAAVSVVRSSGSDLLDEAAREAVAHWTFRPARMAGQPIGADVEVPVTFRLAEAAGP